MSNRLKELREQQEKSVVEARERLDQIDANTDESRTAELEAQHDAAMTEYDRLDAQIEREQKLADIEARAEQRAEELRASRRPNQQDTIVDAVDNGGGMDYRHAFQHYICSYGNVSQMPDEARAAFLAGPGGENRAQTTTNAAGGYTIPTELLNILVKSMAAWGPMYDPGVATELVTGSGGQIDIPTVDDTAKTAGASAGEAVTLTDDGGKDVVIGQKVLNAYSYDTEWIRISKELADDSVMNMENVIGGLLGERLGRLLNTYLTTGTGSGQPNGIVTASSLGKTAAVNSAITTDEIIDLVHSVDPAYRVGPNVRFMFNDSTLQAIRKLKDGNGNYLWNMGNVQQGEASTLLGYRYSINQAIDSIATVKKVMIFGDMGKYFVRKVGAPLIGAIQDKDFWPGIGIAGFVRVDGELLDTAAVKHMIMPV